MIEIFESRFEFLDDQRFDECFSDATAQTKSSVAAMISIILNRKKFVFEVDRIIRS
jgi:hypothetical protein